MKQKNKMWIALFLAPALLMFLLIYLGPLVLAFVSSFTKWNGMQSMRFIGLQNYIQIVKDPVFHTALCHTLLWALLAVCIHVPFGVLVALVLKRKRRGWRFARSVFMLPNIISRSALALMFLFIYKPDVGVLNTLLQGLGLGHLARNWLVDPKTALMSVTNIWLWYAAVITLMVFSELSHLYDHQWRPREFHHDDFRDDGQQDCPEQPVRVCQHPGHYAAGVWDCSHAAVQQIVWHEPGRLGGG